MDGIKLKGKRWPGCSKTIGQEKRIRHQTANSYIIVHLFYVTRSRGASMPLGSCHIPLPACAETSRSEKHTSALTHLVRKSVRDCGFFCGHLTLHQSINPTVGVGTGIKTWALPLQDIPQFHSNYK